MSQFYLRESLLDGLDLLNWFCEREQLFGVAPPALPKKETEKNIAKALHALGGLSGEW